MTRDSWRRAMRKAHTRLRDAVDEIAAVEERAPKLFAAAGSLGDLFYADRLLDEIKFAKEVVARLTAVAVAFEEEREVFEEERYPPAVHLLDDSDPLDEEPQ